MKFTVKENDNGGPGWSVVDTQTGRSVAWIFDQKHGFDRTEVDEERAKLFADALNKQAKETS